MNRVQMRQTMHGSAVYATVTAMTARAKRILEEARDLTREECEEVGEALLMRGESGRALDTKSWLAEMMRRAKQALVDDEGDMSVDQSVALLKTKYGK